MHFGKLFVLAGLAQSVISTNPLYGSVVDTVEAAPPKNQTPAVLANRNNNAAGVFNVTGNYSPACSGCLGGDYILFWNPGFLNITGKGYFWVRYEIAWFNRVGPIIPPSWTGLSGKLFHVASGGGRRMDDLTGASPNCTWMGCDGSRDTLLPGMQQMWQNEYFYLDGNVTLNNNEGWADYNVAMKPLTWEQINNDINLGPDDGVIRYGVSRDPLGDDSAPVPMYLTCDSPAATYNVTQKSNVGGCYDRAFKSSVPQPPYGTNSTASTSLNSTSMPSGPAFLSTGSPSPSSSLPSLSSSSPASSFGSASAPSLSSSLLSLSSSSPAASSSDSASASSATVIGSSTTVIGSPAAHSSTHMHCGHHYAHNKQANKQANKRPTKFAA